MKKIILITFIALMLLFGGSAYASTDGYYPKLIVSDYIIEDEALTPGDTTTITIQIENTHSTKYARNIKLSFEDSTNDILPVKTSSIICPIINSGETFEWEVEVYIMETAADAPHVITITSEYENNRGFNLVSKDTILVDVRQPVRMEYNKTELPVRLTQGDVFSLETDLMNMGKGNIYNALLTYNIEGIANGGSVLVGNIESGKTETGKCNFKVSSDALGPVDGSITITYEDSRGRLYEEIIPVSTQIQEKVAVDFSQSEDEKPEEDKFNWKTLAIVFISLCAVLIIVCAVTIYSSNKLRRDYESKL